MHPCPMHIARTKPGCLGGKGQRGGPSALEFEGDFGADAERLNFIVAQAHVKLFHPNAGNAPQGFLGLHHDLADGIFPGMWGLTDKFNDFYNSHTASWSTHL